MAGGRRSVPKAGTPKPVVHPNTSDDRSGLGGHRGGLSSPHMVMPRHINIPDIPTDGETLFELLALILSAVALASQYLNIYRTVWWLPHSHMDQAMNFYLIDPYVVAFSLLMLGRRFPLNVFKQICLWCVPLIAYNVAVQFFRAIVITPHIISLVWCVYNIILRHGFLTICLGYPIVVYMVVFGAEFLPFFELWTHEQERCNHSKGKTPSHRIGVCILSHICSASPEIIREEVEILKSDFNSRLKKALFHSFLVAYYAGFVPCCFVQGAIHYDLWWVVQHVAFVWLGTFTLYVVHCFPPRYCDILHRSALHLGRWRHLETRNVHVPYNIWSDSTLWHQGALVKHAKGLFKAEGLTNAAEPGNVTHSRFFGVFNDPMGAISGLLGLQMVLITMQLLVLIRSVEWNYMVSTALMLLLNCPTLFKILREYLVLGKIYHTEQMLQGTRMGG